MPKRVKIVFYLACAIIQSLFSRQNWRSLLYFKINPGSYTAYKNALSIDSFTSKQLKEYQTKKLQNLLVHCHQNTPYYRGLFAEHQVKALSAQDFGSIPVFNDEIIIQRYDDLIARNIDTYKWHTVEKSTSGGKSFTFIQNNKTESIIDAQELLILEHIGIKSSDRQLYFASTSQSKIKSFLFNRYFCTTDNNSSKFSMLEFLAACKKINPSVIHFDKEFLCKMLKTKLSEKLSITGIKAIIIPANTVKDDEFQTLKNIFSTNIIELYSVPLLGTLGHSCQYSRNIHLHKSFITEIVDNKLSSVATSEVGEMLITPLYNKAMPVIRYTHNAKVKLISKNSACACGENHITISPLAKI